MSAPAQSDASSPSHTGNPLSSINLPKGGGAIRSIGEKFSVNSATGTGSTSVSIQTSPGRSGFGPQLSLTYDSGSGNGQFGFGWQLSPPSIARKTDDGLPRYLDGEESDVFILSGAEDLVPVLHYKDGVWTENAGYSQELNGVRYDIKQYKPRIEGTFSRIEKWTGGASEGSHWKAITRDNVTTLYGETTNSRICDPSSTGPDGPRIFRWLISKSYDDKGNIMVYEYKAENSQGIDCEQAHELNRNEHGRSAGRYIKRIKYGNRTSLLAQPNRVDMKWMFEVVFDYGEHDTHFPSPLENKPWGVRPDPFSIFRSCFEIRTYRLCHRVLMFHHFPDEPEIGQDCLVSSLDISYQQNEGGFNQGNRIASFVSAFTERAYVRRGDSYQSRSLPPIEFRYSQPIISDHIQELDSDQLENLPMGMDDATYRWIDIDTEGVPGVLAQQGGSYYYKANLGDGRFGPLETLANFPSTGDANSQWMDLSGSGKIGLVQLGGPCPGFYKRDRTLPGGWDNFRPFESLPNEISLSRDIQYLDLTGDGLTDVLVAGDDVFTWYPSMGELGYGPAEYAPVPVNEQRGPRLLAADVSTAVYAADMTGDGLSDLVRIRNGEIAYWPNIGYGQFGTMITMDNSPWFDLPDAFQQNRLKLFDIDGSGTTDLIYLGADETRYYQNQSGNAWTDGHCVSSFPKIENTAQVQVVDLLGRGTGCLVWSSPLPFNAGSQVRYIDLMAGGKPHLLVFSTNNIGSESRIHYAPSTKFYLQDKAAGNPWVTRLPFPVQVVERVETYDYIGRNRFVSRYAYHHGYFDGADREFRGFGMLEQWDTEEFATLQNSDHFPAAVNIDSSSNVPPVLTKSWYHTGAYIEGLNISRHFETEYYREPELDDHEYRAMLLDDTVLPDSIQLAGGRRVKYEISSSECQEACRALKGQLLRREVYGLDGTEAACRPYSVEESNYTIEMVQAIGGNRHAVFYSHPREAVSFSYERALYAIGDRQLADPRVSHELTTETDEFGNVLQSVSVSYGRRHKDTSNHLTPEDHLHQRQSKITYTDYRFTNSVSRNNVYRTPVHAESTAYELLGIPPPYSSNSGCFTSLYQMHELRRSIGIAADGKHDIPYEDFEAKGIAHNCPHRRLLKQNRALYRRDDLTGPLPLGEQGSLGLPYESYLKAMSETQANHIYVGSGKVPSREELCRMMHDEGKYVHSGGDKDWWAPSGRVFYSPHAGDTPEMELDYAQRHFFMAMRFRDPFHSSAVSTEYTTTFDAYDLLLQETRDPFGNRVTAGERALDPELPLLRKGLDYRLLKPVLSMDANRNRAAVAYDILGFVAGSAVMGKPEEYLGDSLEGLIADLTENEIVAHFGDPLATAGHLLANATTRYVYDVFAYQRNRSEGTWDPTRMSTIARETHNSSLQPGEKTKFMFNVSYFDGSRRVIQQKVHAGSGPLYRQGTPSSEVVPHRFICNGWTIFNNKGNPVRKYEPFYSRSAVFEFGVRIGVTSTLFYDTTQRVVATLFADNTWSKAVFDAWGEQKWDANDTVLLDPTTDAHVGDFFRRLGTTAGGFKTWYGQRKNGDMGPRERDAARKAAEHAETPTRKYADSRGRPFLTVEHNRFKNRSSGPAIEEFYRTFTQLDAEGNTRYIRDAKGRKVVSFEYDMLGKMLHQQGMEAGELWKLEDVSGGLIYGWDSRQQRFRTVFDAIRRSTEVHLSTSGTPEILVERSVYGETMEHPETHNRRLRVVKVMDQAGTVDSGDYDFKGNILSSHRQFAREYKDDIDWNCEVDMEPVVHRHYAAFDAINRTVEVTSTDGSVTRNFYNDSGLLERVEVCTPGGGDFQPYVDHIEYNARGQRQWIQYSNKVRTTSTYHPLTYYLESIVTHRGRLSFPTEYGSDSFQRDQVQSLEYTYDPIGNIVHIQDNAQQRIFFRNQCVDPSTENTYDAVYRLIRSSGREHLGQRKQDSRNHRNDGTAMARYTESYQYDSCGNMLSLRHESADPTHGTWTRHYDYLERSQIEPETFSNRLSGTTCGGSSTNISYDGEEGLAGNITSMSTIPSMRWDPRNNLKATARQAVREGLTPETTFYRYDGRGYRVRKVTERQRATEEKPTVLKQRYYLGNYEIFCKYGGDGQTKSLEIQTLRTMDDEKCITIRETRTIGDTPGPGELLRYQLSNHQGSVSIELDSNAQLLTYEEYSPYGETTYSATQGTIETPKRYQYSGKELDSESGLYYYGARYYVPYLCRWISCDPGGFGDGLNLYEFVKCNPMSKKDPNGTESSWLNRALGAIATAGGALEIAAGAAGIAAPTGASQVIGAAAAAHGLDTTWAGLKQVWTGEQQKTYTQQAATGVAKAAGVSDSNAETVGLAADIIAGMIPEAGAAAGKATSDLIAGNRASKAIRALGSVTVAGAHQLGSTGIAVLKKAIGATGTFIDDALSLIRHSLPQAPLVIGAGAGHLNIAGAGVGAHAGIDRTPTVSGRLSSAQRETRPVIHAGMTRAEVLHATVLASGGYNTATPPKHHVYPQQFAAAFAIGGIQIHEELIELNQIEHQIIHGNWGHFPKWNTEWANWFLLNPPMPGSGPAMRQQMHNMLHDYGIDGPDRRWFNAAGHRIPNPV